MQQAGISKDLVWRRRAHWRRRQLFHGIRHSHTAHSLALVIPDNTANITVKYGPFDRDHAKFHYLPVLISDNGSPSLTSTNTLTVVVCKCNQQGTFTFCEEAVAQVGVSIQALVAIFLCILTIAGQCLMGRPGTPGASLCRALGPGYHLSLRAPELQPPGCRGGGTGCKTPPHSSSNSTSK